MIEDNNIIVESNGDETTVFATAYVGAKVGGSTISSNSKVESEQKVDDVEQSSLSTDGYAQWGNDNMYPTNARIKAEKCGVFSQNAFIKACMFFGNGINYYKKTNDGLIEHQDDEIDEFVENSNIPYYILESIGQFYIHFMSFAEYRMNKGSSQDKSNKIKAISALETEWSRIGITKKGISKLLYYSPQFAENGSFDDNNGSKIPLLYNTSKDDFIKYLGSNRKFASVVKFPTPGRPYYSNAPWSDLFEEDSWLDVAINTPKSISSIHKHLINIKYVIHIPMNYWQFRYPKWDTYTAKNRKKLIDKKAVEMNDYLAGSKNHHKSFIAHFGFDPVSGKEYPGFKIEAIKDYTKHDAYLPNSQAANAEICYHQGISPSVIGMQTPGGKLGAGSGSDIRVSTNREVALLKALEYVVMQPLSVVNKWNGWKDIVWQIERPFITTLDEDKQGQTVKDASQTN